MLLYCTVFYMGWHHSLSYKCPIIILLLHHFIGNNNLHGTIPGELQHLLSLRHLSLENNHLEGQVPLGLGTLAEEDLEEIYLQGTNITGSLEFFCKSSSSTLDIQADIGAVDCSCCTFSLWEKIRKVPPQRYYYWYDLQGRVKDTLHGWMYIL